MGQQDALSIEVVANAAHERDFFSLRRKIYQNDPAVVHPLGSMERMALDPSKHPFYEHATREAFVCYRAGVPVGRICAIIDSMHNQHYQDRVGFFGFFEAIDDQGVVNLLVETAEKWLRQRGCDTMRGPVNPSMKGEFGVLVEGHDDPPTVMMSYTKARYQGQLVAAGLVATKTFHAFRFRSSEVKNSKERWEHMASAKQKILARFPQLEIRSVSAQNYEQTFREINQLGNVVRSEGWGFVPLTENELAFMINNLRRVIRFDMIHVAYWDGQLVGYIVNIPDVNWALRKTVGRWDWLRMLQLPFWLKRTPRTRVIALGVDQNFRKKGIAMLLIGLLTDVYDAYQEWEFSWVDADNVKSLRAIERSVPLIKSKTYKLLEKPII